MNLVQARFDAPHGQLKVGDQIMVFSANVAGVVYLGRRDVSLGVRPNSFAIVRLQKKHRFGGAVSPDEHVDAESSIPIAVEWANTVYDCRRGSAHKITATEPGDSTWSRESAGA
jgi:hypothetical protein